MRQRSFLFKIVNRIILSLIAVLGFSCSSDDPIVEYGSPSADFNISGNIIDETTLEKLSNIQIISNNASSSTFGDTIYSENGHYEIVKRDYPSSQVFVVTFKDTSNLHQTLDTLVDFTDPVFENGDGSWYYGETSKEVDIKLTPEN